ncbi:MULTISPECIES: hypothetical protein [Streptomyces]|nr:MULTISPECIES: hypothetical protein [Streptomyces]
MLEWVPVLQLGVGVLDADPLGGLPSWRFLPGVLLAGRRVVLRFFGGR